MKKIRLSLALAALVLFVGSTVLTNVELRTVSSKGLPNSHVNKPMAKPSPKPLPTPLGEPTCPPYCG